MPEISMESNSTLKQVKTDSHADSPIKRIPEEILLKIFEHTFEQVLLEEDVKELGSVPWYKGNSLLRGCMQVSRQWQRLGKEILFRYCDVSDSSDRRPYLLLRSLLECPELRPKVRTLTLCINMFALVPENGYVSSEGLFDDSVVVSDEFRPLLPMLLHEVMPLYGGLLDEIWLKFDLKSYDSAAWVGMIFALAPNIRKLRLLIREESDYWKPFLNLRYELEKHKITEHLESVELHVQRDSPEILSPGLQLKVVLERELRSIAANARVLTLSCPYLPLKHLNLIPPGDLNPLAWKSDFMRTVILRGFFRRTILNSIHHVFPCLRSITFELCAGAGGDADRNETSGIYDAQDIFSAMVNATMLEKLEINACGNTSSVQPTWPRNLHDFKALMVFTMKDVDLNASTHYAALPTMLETLASDFFPPNIEKVVVHMHTAYGLGALLIHDMETALFTGFEKFVRNKQLRPATLQRFYFRCIPIAQFSLADMVWERFPEAEAVLWQPLRKL